MKICRFGRLRNCGEQVWGVDRILRALLARTKNFEGEGGSVTPPESALMRI